MDQGELLKTLLHEMKDGVVVCDPEAKITLFNTAAEDLFGQVYPFVRGLVDAFQMPLQGVVAWQRHTHK